MRSVSHDWLASCLHAALGSGWPWVWPVGWECSLGNEALAASGLLCGRGWEAFSRSHLGAANSTSCFSGCVAAFLCGVRGNPLWALLKRPRDLEMGRGSLFARLQSAPFTHPAAAHLDGEPACLTAHFLRDHLSTGALGQHHADTNFVLSGH